MLLNQLGIARYFKRYWDETTGEALTDAWGTSTFYFETDEQLNDIRQMQVFEKGKFQNITLTSQMMNLGCWLISIIDKDEFEEFAVDETELTGIWHELDRKTI